MNHLVNNQAEVVDINFLRANKELLTEPVIFIRKWIGEVIILYNVENFYSNFRSMFLFYLCVKKRVIREY